MNKDKKKVVSIISKGEVIMQVDGYKIKRSSCSDQLLMVDNGEIVAIFQPRLKYLMVSERCIYYKITV